MPVVISSCSFGSESNSSAGNGVRSRMITTISLSAMRGHQIGAEQVLGDGAYADAGQRVPVGEGPGHALVVVEDGAGQHGLMLPEPVEGSIGALRQAQGASERSGARVYRRSGRPRLP